MSEPVAFAGAQIFDGENWHEDSVLVVARGRVAAIMPEAPPDVRRVSLDGGLLVPGFIDLQVNGGGGVQFNDTPTLDGIRAICHAHQRFGVTACLPTIITDTPAVFDLAAEAGLAAAAAGVPGFMGLHFEGPHLSPARRGAHEAALIRPFADNDLQRLIHVRSGMPAVLATVAPEAVGPEEIAALARAGVLVSIGHSDADHAMIAEAAAAGARMVTHLFNAQSQLRGREPGVVGAALDIGALHAGLIADGIHVHPASVGIAVRGKRSPGRVFLVSDAMAVAGTDHDRLTLNGRTVLRHDGALRLADGTLAGADLTMIEAVRFMHRVVGLPLGEALRMAALYPAEAVGLEVLYGQLKRGARADFVHLGPDLSVRGTFILGEEVFAG